MTDNAPRPAADTLPRLLAERYGAGWSGAVLEKNSVIETLLAHRSVRAFRSDPLPPGTLETLVAAAQSAATSSNLQTFSIVAIEKADTKKKLAALSGHQAHVAACPLLLAFVADLSRIERMAGKAGRKSDGLDYLEMYLIAAIDASLAAQNAAIAAESLGLGICYIGSLRNNPDEVHALLRLPRKAMAVFGLTVGWPDPARPAAIKPRLPIDVVLHRETYATDQAAGIAAYDAALGAFNRRENQPSPDWTSRTLSRVETAESLTGRHRLKDLLRGLGFGLK